MGKRRAARELALKFLYQTEFNSENPDLELDSFCQRINATEEIQGFTAQKGQGCSACDGSGYKGRQGIYEVLRVTPEVEEAILKQAQAPEILEAARTDNFMTMQEVGRDYIRNGILSLEEFTRVLVVN